MMSLATASNLEATADSNRLFGQHAQFATNQIANRAVDAQPFRYWCFRNDTAVQQCALELSCVFHSRAAPEAVLCLGHAFWAHNRPALTVLLVRYLFSYSIHGLPSNNFFPLHLSILRVQRGLVRTWTIAVFHSRPLVRRPQTCWNGAPFSAKGTCILPGAPYQLAVDGSRGWPDRG